MGESETRKVVYRREGPIAYFALNRPDRRNALNREIWDGIDHSIQDGLDYVSSRSAGILMSEDVFEAFAAFAEKRKPEFKGR